LAEISLRREAESKVPWAGHFDLYAEIIPDYDDFKEALKREHPSHLRVNLLKTTPDSLIPRLRKWGGRLTPLPIKGAYSFTGLERPGATLEYFLGHYHLQGLSSMLPPLLLDLAPGQKIIDLCASPGSKTTQIAALTGNRALIVANELKRRRLGILKYHIERLGVLSTLITNYQAQNFPMRLPDGRPLRFDRVLLDAPCTGEGRHREVMRDQEMELMQPWSPGSSLRMSGYQKQMILRGFDLLSEGGILVYSTCTYSPIENEAVIQHLLDNRETASIEEAGIEGIKTAPGITCWEGREFSADMKKTIRIYPHYLDSWGFFIAKIRKAC
jgi:NOL1/NOP2/sun family putative RNA methylase